MAEKDCYDNNITDNLSLKTVEEAELSPHVYEKPQIIKVGWKNIGFTIVFWIHTLVVIFIALLLGQPALLYYSALSSDESFKQVSLLFNIEIIFHALAAATIIGCLMSFIAFFILQLCAGRTIKCLFIFTITIQVFVAFVIIIVGLWPAYITMGVTLLILITIAIIITTIYFFCVRRRVPFAEAHLRVGCAILRSHSSLILVAICMLVIQILWFTIWYIMVIGIHHVISDLPLSSNIDTKVNAIGTTTTTTTISPISTRIRLINVTTYWNEEKQDRFNTTVKRTGDNIEVFRCYMTKTGRGHGSLIIEFALLYSFYWGAATFRNIVHFITACTVGQWWFSGDTRRQYAITTSFKRAFTTNFGTIAFGSLLVSIDRGLRFCVQRDKRNTNIVKEIVACCAACVLRKIEKLFGYVNRWAFNYAALTGEDFIDASRSFIQLFEARGWTMVINDDLLGTALTIVTFTVGLTSATVGSLIFYTFTPNSSSRNIFTIHIAFISFVVGASMSTIMTSILSSCVRTVFICFALNPTILGVTHPKHLKNLTETWHKFPPETLTPSDCTTVLPRPVSAENV